MCATAMVITRIDVGLRSENEKVTEREREREYNARSRGDRRVEVGRRVCKQSEGE